MTIIGGKTETNILNKLLDRQGPQFFAVYARRRIGRHISSEKLKPCINEAFEKSQLLEETKEGAVRKISHRLESIAIIFRKMKSPSP